MLFDWAGKSHGLERLVCTLARALNRGFPGTPQRVRLRELREKSHHRRLCRELDSIGELELKNLGTPSLKYLGPFDDLANQQVPLSLAESPARVHRLPRFLTFVGVWRTFVLERLSCGLRIDEQLLQFLRMVFCDE